MKPVKFLFATLLLLILTQSRAQLSFPNGTNLDLLSHVAGMYDETAIFFHTGIYNVKDYEWHRSAFDSIDPRWSFMACMNGFCIPDLPSKGTFTEDLGPNDTTGFMKFHVFTNGYNGSSIISYKVINKQNAADQATLTYHIIYEQTTALDEVIKDNRIAVYPNPASDNITINCNEDFPEYFEIYDYTGKLMHTVAAGTSTSIDLGAFSNGIYFIRSQSTQPFMFRVNK